MNPSADVISRSPRNIFPAHVADFQLRGVAILSGVDAWCNVDGLIHIREANVPEGNIFHVTGTWVGLDPCSIGAVGQSDIFEKNILNIVRLSCLRTNASNYHSARLMTDNVADVHVCGISLGANTILEV